MGRRVIGGVKGSGGRNGERTRGRVSLASSSAQEEGTQGSIFGWTADRDGQPMVLFEMARGEVWG